MTKGKYENNTVVFLLSVSILPILIIFLELIGRYDYYDSNVIPLPTDVFFTALEMVSSGELLNDILISLKRWSIGFFSASILGITVGVLTARFVIIRIAIQPIVQFFRPIPAISFVPLAIVWFGIGEQAKYFLIMWGAFFPIWLNTHLGVINVHHSYIWAARSLGASNMRIIFSVIIPAALPFIFAGLRTGIAVGFICLVAAEMAGAYEGLGFRITASHLVFRIDKMFVALIALGALGAITDKLFTKIVEHFFPWMPHANEKVA